MRQFDDIDLIMPAGDILRARSVLLSNGFKDKLALSEKEMRHQIKYGWGLAMVSADGDFIVELDSGVLHRYQSLMGLDEAEVWGRAVDYTIYDTTVKVLPPELELLMLCLHGTKHCWERLVWVADVAGVVARTVIDWSMILRESHKCGCLRSVLVGMDLAHKIFGASIHHDVARLVEGDCNVKNNVKWAIDELVGCGELSLWQETRFNLLCRDNPGDRIRYCFRSVFDPSFADLQRLDVHERLSWLYYVVRPARLATRMIRWKGW